uniref:DUF4139 domain-containing protein n=1 Tax=Steinernema glaseri TaxID=37863 RepID=A0A1I7Y9G3_9BILA
MASSKLIFQASKLPIYQVTIYNDRAEVKRELRSHLAAGFHELVIENLASTIDSNSIHIEGTRIVRIHEVSFRNDRAEEEEDSLEIKVLKEEGQKLQNEKNKLEDGKTTTKKALDALNAMVTRFDLPKNGEKFVFDQDVRQSMANFFSFYNEEASHCQNTLRGVDTKIKTVQRDMEDLSKKIRELRTSEETPLFCKKMLIIVEVLEEGHLDLVISYQVSRVKWHPAYDLRVTTDEEPIMEVSCFAKIQQKTGEDWTDAKIFLSTAQPSINGKIPELGTLHASIYRPLPTMASTGPFGAPKGGLFGPSAAQSPFAFASLNQSDMDTPRRDYQDGVTADENMPVEYEIAMKKTISSDDSEHKVLIYPTSFEPSLLHECVPKKSTNVFLTASVVNNSEFPLLEGDASVYLNHSFVAKTHLKAVAPGEKFTCSLGVDNAVKVTYKAPERCGSEAGMLYRQATVCHTQVINIQNNKPHEVTVLVRDHVPKAIDDRIKVKLLKPDNEGKQSEGASNQGWTLNADNNLEWKVIIAEGEQEKLTMTWQIEYPSNEHVDFKEVR